MASDCECESSPELDFVRDIVNNDTTLKHELEIKHVNGIFITERSGGNIADVSKTRETETRNDSIENDRIANHEPIIEHDNGRVNIRNLCANECSQAYSIDASYTLNNDERKCSKMEILREHRNNSIDNDRATNNVPDIEDNNGTLNGFESDSTKENTMDSSYTWNNDEGKGIEIGDLLKFSGSEPRSDSVGKDRVLNNEPNIENNTGLFNIVESNSNEEDSIDSTYTLDEKKNCREMGDLLMKRENARNDCVENDGAITNNEQDSEYHIEERNGKEMGNLFENSESETRNDLDVESEFSNSNTRSDSETESETSSDSDDELLALDVFKQIFSLNQFDECTDIDDASDSSQDSSSSEEPSTPDFCDVFEKMKKLCTKYSDEKLHESNPDFSNVFISIVELCTKFYIDNNACDSNDNNACDSNPDFGEVFKRIFELCTKLWEANLHENCDAQLPSGLSDGIILIVEKILKWLYTSESETRSDPDDESDTRSDSETESETRSDSEDEFSALDVFQRFFSLIQFDECTDIDDVSDSQQDSSSSEVPSSPHFWDVFEKMKKLCTKFRDKNLHENNPDFSDVYIRIVELCTKFTDIYFRESNPDFGDVFKRIFELCTKLWEANLDENGHAQLPSSLSDGIILIVEKILKWLNTSERETRSDPDENIEHENISAQVETVLHSLKECFLSLPSLRISYLSIWSFTTLVYYLNHNYLNKIFKLHFPFLNREYGNAANDPVNEKKGNIKQHCWIDMICELLDLLDHCQLNGCKDSAENKGASVGKTSKQKNKKEAKSAHMEGTNGDANGDENGDAIGEANEDQNKEANGDQNREANEEENWTDIIKDLVRDLVKIWMWICSGYKEAASENFIADDVIDWSDGSFSINDLLHAVNNKINRSSDAHRWLYTAYELHMIILKVAKRAILKMFPNESLTKPGFPFQQISEMIHWLNDNSCEFTNIKCADEQPPVIVSWFREWLYLKFKSLSPPSDHSYHLQCCELTASILMLFQIKHIIILKKVGKIFPDWEYVIRKTMSIILSWLLCFFAKMIPFAEKTCMFGKRLVKEVSVLELLCYMNQDNQPTPAEFTELQDVLNKLIKAFKVESISKTCKPAGLQSEQQNVVTHADTVNGESVIDQLWSKYEDTLAQSNWCNAYIVVTQNLGLALDELKNFYNPYDKTEMWLDDLHEQCNFKPFLSGSRLDGCVSLLSGPGNACDIDLMHPKFRSGHFQMRSVPGRPTSVAVCGQGTLYSPFNIRNILYIQEYITIAGFNFICSQFHSKLNTAHSVQCGEVAITLLLFKGKDVVLSMDNVPAMVIESWPEQALKWIHRNAEWPNHQDREIIALSGCHAVPKTPKGGNPDNEWRLSFSKPENMLCKMFTPSQAFHLCLLKTQFQGVKCKIGSSKVRIFKNYTISEGEFHTYHAKTAMFWFCESHPPGHDIWRKENVFQCQFELLESMERMMREGNIPHFFIPEQNLLQDIPVELLRQAAGELRVLKEEARTENGRVYQEIIKPSSHVSFSQILAKNP